jgi:hypothetical protein
MRAAWWSERGSGGHPIAIVGSGAVEEAAAPCSALEELRESAAK